MINWPTAPSGDSSEASFMRRLIDCCKRSTPKAGPGMMIEERADGIIFRPTLQFSNSGQTSFQMFQITSCNGQSDYFQAKLLTPNGTVSGSEMQVAKSVTGRQPVCETIDTFEITYTYSDDNNRVATAAMLGTEVQVCHPRYKVGDTIAVVTIENPQLVDDTRITLYEISPERFWCAAPDGFTPPGS